MASETEPMLSPGFLRKLEQWSLAIRRSATGQYGGERRSTRHGHSVEFADFRHYTPGDDLRFIDWNLYARLERLYLKMFLHEQEINVHVLLDLSESMTFGEPKKSALARKLSAALGYLALAHQDGLSISVGTESTELRQTQFPTCRGKGFANRMMTFLKNAPEGGRLDMQAFVKNNVLRWRRPGLVIIISDFLEPDGFEQPMRRIMAGRHEIIAIHLLDREELDPTWRGDLRLIDAESDDPTEVSITPATLKAYKKRVRDWSNDMEAFCLKRGITYLQITSEHDPEEIVLKTLRRLGRLK